MTFCNADLGHPCDAGGRDEDDNAIPCDACAAYMRIIEREARREWAAASPQERNPARYEADMRDSGRRRLLP